MSTTPQTIWNTAVLEHETGMHFAMPDYDGCYECDRAKERYWARTKRDNVQRMAEIERNKTILWWLGVAFCLAVLVVFTLTQTHRQPATAAPRPDSPPVYHPGEVEKPVRSSCTSSGPLKSVKVESSGGILTVTWDAPKDATANGFLAIQTVSNDEEELHQYGVKFLHGDQIAQFDSNGATARQTNYSKDADLSGGKVTAYFPASVGESFRWQGEMELGMTDYFCGSDALTGKGVRHD